MEFIHAYRTFAWLVAYALCLSVADILMAPHFDDFRFAFFAGALMLTLWVMLICWSLGLSLHFVAERRWLLVFLGLALGFLTPTATLKAEWYLQDVRDIAHFRALRPQYDAEVARLPHNGSRYAEFNWGGMLFSSRGITYDETDQLRLSSDRQTSAWKARMKNTDVYCGEDRPVGEVLALGNHYYLTTFGC